VGKRDANLEREAPKVRDMPAPRKSEGAAGGAMQRIFAWPYRGILAFLLWAGVRPYQLTLLSLALNIAVGTLIITGDWLVAGLLLILAGLCDVFDGSVARQRGEEKRSGAFMDSVLDRVSDAILFSCLFWALSANGVSLSVSHVRAEAEAVGVTLTEGFFQRLERFLALIVGLLIPGAMRPVLIVLTVLGGITLLQRSWSAVQDAR
jgi:CDP-diacylglycerol--glycerol-3-phosphate 3-phosphatidyltransferase